MYKMECELQGSNLPYHGTLFGKAKGEWSP